MEQNLKNYFYLKYNPSLSQYISHILESLINSKPNQILLSSPIIIRENNSSIITFFKQLNENFIYMNLISLNNPKENKIKEVKIQFKKEKKFICGEILFSLDKSHLIIFNESRNKVYIIPKFLDEIIINNNDIIELQEKNYFEIEKGKILDMKFNITEDKDDNDIILYALYCDNKTLTVFNNKYMNKQFQIYLNTPLVDFQIVKMHKNEYNLFLFDLSGNFTCIKNIQDPKNIPKSDRFNDNNNNLINKIEIYDRILNNINNFDFMNEYKNCYFLNSHINDNMQIISIIRTSYNFFDIGILVNDKIFIIKKYNFDINNEEINDKIIPLNDEINKCLIKTNKNIYLLDMPSLALLFEPLSSNQDNNGIKQDILLIINEILSKINLSLLLKLPSKINLNNFAINYNFYKNKILCIKNSYPNVVIKIYDFEIESVNSENIIHDNNIENKKNKSDENQIIMKNLLESIEQEKEIFIKNELKENQKEEYYNKILEEIYNNINMNEIDKNLININDSIELMKDWYINAFTNIKLYGEVIKSKYNIINNNIEKSKTFSEQIQKSDELIQNLKKNIEYKKELLKKNEKEITLLKKESDNLINDFYLINSNNSEEEKNFTNELVIRANNYILKNIKYLENNLINVDESLSSINFQQIKNFPLTMKYLDTTQKEKIKSLINSINNFMNTLRNFHKKIQEKEKEE